MIFKLAGEKHSFVKNDETNCWDRTKISDNAYVIHTVALSDGIRQYAYAMQQNNRKWIWVLNGMTSLDDFGLADDSFEEPITEYNTLDECCQGLYDWFTCEKL
jgi:hypothetical protein